MYNVFCLKKKKKKKWCNRLKNINVGRLSEDFHFKISVLTCFSPILSAELKRLTQSITTVQYPSNFIKISPKLYF